MSRRFAYWAAAVAAMLGLLSGSVAMLPKPTTSHASAPAAAPMATVESSCSAVISRTIVPDVIRSCERSTVTLRLRPFCPGEPINVVLVLWAYARPSDAQPLYAQWTAAAVDALQISSHPNIRAGIVRASDSGTILLDLTNDEDMVRRASRIKYRYDMEWNHFCIPCSYQKAAQVLEDGAPGERNVMISIMGWDWQVGSPWQEDWAQAARIGKKAADTFMMGCPQRFGFHRGCRVDTAGAQSDWWRQASPGYYFETRGPFEQAIGKLVAGSTKSAVASLTVDEQWPAGVDVVPLSVVPPATLIDPVNRRLRWEIAAPITRPLTLTYQVAPLGLGIHTFGAGRLILTDTKKLTRLVPAPTGVLTVTGPCVTPSFTPSPAPTSTETATPGPTATWTAIATVSPTPTATPSATPTAVPAPIWLPMALHEECVPGQKRVDVVLAIDASTSMMQEHTSDGRTKLDAATDAAQEFLDLLHLAAGDQAAIVAFNDSAALLAPLTGDRDAVDRALGAIQTAQHTCLACAVDVAAMELASDRHKAVNKPVLVLLTDGRSNPRPASEAVARAVEAKRAGIVIFTIGLGTDLDDAALAAIASQRDYYYQAPTAAQLADIYRQIAVAIPCPAEAFWGRR